MSADDLTKRSFRALIYEELEDYEETIRNLSNFLDSHPTNSDAFNNRVVARWEIGKTEDALRDFENAILADPNNPMPYVNKGDVLKRQSEYQRAIESYSQAIELDGDKSYCLCRAYTYVDMNLSQEAVEDFTFVLRLAPDHKATYAARGKALEAIGDKVRAAKDFEKARE